MKIAFVCVHNSCRSIMAEGYLRAFSKPYIEAFSAGTHINGLNSKAVEVMKADGIDMSFAKSKLIETLPNDLDVVITMGCNVSCPDLKSTYRFDFGIDDPSGKNDEAYFKARKLIKNKVLNLIDCIEKGCINEFI